jgi:sugar phosphate isomerase/epimerase
MHRRTFVRAGGVLAGLAAWPAAGTEEDSRREPRQTPSRLMKIALTPGSIGVSAGSQLELNALAHRHRYEAVEPRTAELADMTEAQIDEVLTDLRDRQLAWAAAGLPVDFRGAEATFRQGLADLPHIARALRRAGVTRVGTWLSPASNTLTYRQSFDQMTTRLREVAVILRDHGQRLGLEYVGTPRSRIGMRYPSVHTLADTRELIDAIGTGNVGLVLDTWHWFAARDTVEDLHRLSNTDVVSVDLNDAPDLALADLRDNRRELPGATGVIDVTGFVGALRAMNYDGPVRPEPFNQAVNAMDNDLAAAVAIQALRRVIDSPAPA